MTDTSSSAWHPLANNEIIKKRAELYQQIRAFMDERQILEVDTPILSQHGNSDPYVESLTARSKQNKEYYLHTSPEFCMKRLLAAETGSIYQIAHVFRDEVEGKRHLIEFAMLEWYRVGFDYRQLMQEVGDLLMHIGLPQPDVMTYAEAFQQTLSIDPHSIEAKDLCDYANRHGWETETSDRHALLDYLFSSVVIEQCQNDKPLIIYDYPVCMAALATIRDDKPPVSERFELFINGMEIANGFNELTDAVEQRQRFEQELSIRKERKMATPKLDEFFLAALEAGMPKSAGIALGLDRLLMLLTDKSDINAVSTFTLENN